MKMICQGFLNRCIRPDTLIDINNVFEIYKINLAWQNKVMSRNLISQQLQGIGIISNITEITEDLNFREEIEKI